MLVKSDESDIMFYEDFKESSESFNQAVNEGSNKHFAFNDLSSDLFSLVYKSNPSFVDGKIPSGLKIAKQALEQVTQCREYNELRQVCKLDPFAAGYATQTLLPTLSKYLPPVGHTSPEDIQAQLDALKDIQDQCQGDLSKQVKRDINKLNKQLTEIDNKNNLADSRKVDPDKLRAVVREALQEAQGAVQDALDDLHALGYGEQAGQAQAVNLADKMALAKRVKQSKKLRDILDIAGRMVRTARKKQAEKSTASEITDIEVGDAISRLLPSEYLKLDEDLEVLFYQGYAEKQLLQYKLEGKEKKAKGPIIFIMDESGSMAGQSEVYCKAIALAMMDIARKQQRDFCFIAFSSPGQLREFYAPKGKINQLDLLYEIEQFMDGGTDYATPLTRALSVLNSSAFQASDCLFFSDGEAYLSPEFLEQFHKVKQDKGFSCYGIAIGLSDRVMREFCDETWSVYDITKTSEVEERIFKI